MASSKIYTLLALLAVVASVQCSEQKKRSSPSRSPSPSPSPPPPSSRPSSDVLSQPSSPPPPSYPPPPVPGCFTDVDCFPSDPCKIASCVAGVCIESPFVCTTTDLCLPQICVGGTCVTDTANSLICDVSNPCTPQACDATSGIPTCVMKEVDCDDGNACTKDACVVTNGLPVCENTADADICYSAEKGDDKCYPKVCKAGATPTEYTCEKVPVVCDDADKCTMDMCNPADGTCIYKSVCDSGKKSKMYPGSYTPSAPQGKQLYTSFADYLSGGSTVATPSGNKYGPNPVPAPTGKYVPSPVKAYPAPVAVVAPTPYVKAYPAPVAVVAPTPYVKTYPAPVAVVAPTPAAKTYPAPVAVVAPTPAAKTYPAPVAVVAPTPTGKPQKKYTPVPSPAKTGLSPGDY